MARKRIHKSKHHPVNIMISDETDEMMKKIAKTQDIKGGRSGTVRWMTEWFHDQLVKAQQGPQASR